MGKQSIPQSQATEKSVVDRAVEIMASGARGWSDALAKAADERKAVEGGKK